MKFKISEIFPVISEMVDWLELWIKSSCSINADYQDPGSCNSFNGSEDEEDDNESRRDELQEEESCEGGQINPCSLGFSDRTGLTRDRRATNDELEKFRRQWRSEINSQNLSSRAQPSPFAVEVHSDADRVWKLFSEYLAAFPSFVTGIIAL